MLAGLPVLLAALLLSAFAEWAITPLLMLGGVYLCYEGAEKLLHLFQPHDDHAREDEAVAALTSEQLENEKVSGAIRTAVRSRQRMPTLGSPSSSSSTPRNEDCHSGRLRGSAR